MEEPHRDPANSSAYLFSLSLWERAGVRGVVHQHLSLTLTLSGRGGDI